MENKISVNVVSSGMVEDAYDKDCFLIHNSIPMNKVINIYEV
ncbi:hypothetical protein [Ascidiimonas sp. W6]